MKFLKNIFFIIILFWKSILIAQIEYPKTKKNPVIDIYHNVKVVDNYRWLESVNSDEVLDWVKNQNKISKKYLKRLSRKNNSIFKMKVYGYHEMDYDNLTEVEKNKEIYYRIMYPGPNSLPNIYIAKGNKSSYEKLVSSNSISIKDRINFTGFEPSFDDKYLAYHYNRNGSDWEEIKIIGIKKKHFFKEVLKEILSPQINWYNDGFFYLRHKYNPDKVSRKFPEIRYHKLGTEQSADELIFKVDNGDEYLEVSGTNNQSLYFIKKSNRLKNLYSYYYYKPDSGNKKFKPIYENTKYDISIVRFKSDTLITLTKIKNKKFLFKVPLNQPKKWDILTPSYNDAIFTDYEFANDKIVTLYQTENSSFLTISDFNGKVLGEVVMPLAMGVSKLFYDKNKKEFTFSLSSFTVPPVRCQLNLNDYTFKYLGKSAVNFDFSNYHFTKTEFASYDGKKIPIFMVYKDSIKKNNKTPFLLKTYGGYGIISKPSFDPGIIYFIENGGAFAYVHIRGSGDFGYEWWQEGKNLKKKNGILDFTSAAKFLIDEGYTKKKRIAVTGSSHGGLIAAAAIMKSPDLYGSAVIDVGALDMLRMEQTQTGEDYVNINEFGSVKNEKEFLNLLSYSPLHNIKENVNYPSMLIITGSNDTRVPPYQSYKFAGKLQNVSEQKDPILLWSQDKVGHLGASKYNRIIEERAFIYGFLIHELDKD